jgi:hypothetical protein
MTAALSIWTAASVPRVLDLCRNLDHGGRCLVMITTPPDADHDARALDDSEPIDAESLARLLREQLGSDAFRIEREGHDRVVVGRV